MQESSIKSSHNYRVNRWISQNVKFISFTFLQRESSWNFWEHSVDLKWGTRYVLMCFDFFVYFVERRSTRSVKVTKRPKIIRKKDKLITNKSKVLQKSKTQVKQRESQSVAMEALPRMYGISCDRCSQSDMGHIWAANSPTCFDQSWVYCVNKIHQKCIVLQIWVISTR